MLIKQSGNFISIQQDQTTTKVLPPSAHTPSWARHPLHWPWPLNSRVLLHLLGCLASARLSCICSPSIPTLRAQTYSSRYEHILSMIAFMCDIMEIVIESVSGCLSFLGLNVFFFPPSFGHLQITCKYTVWYFWLLKTVLFPYFNISSWMRARLYCFIIKCSISAIPPFLFLFDVAHQG